MKYVRAKIIRDLVTNLNMSWDKDYFRAAIVRDYPHDDIFSVHLFSGIDATFQLCELAAFACSLEKLTCGLTVSLDSYDKGTTEPDIVQSVRIH